MTREFRRLAVVTAAAVTALLAFGVTAASAHGGPGRGIGGGRVSLGPLVTRSASELGVTRARLKAAILDSAVAAIDAAAEDGDIDEDQAAELKEDAEDNLRVAYELSKTRTVASELGVTTARLNNAFRAARKALILARINAAVEDGDLDEDEAAELRQDLEQATLPGYKSPRGFGFGHGPGRRGR